MSDEYGMRVEALVEGFRKTTTVFELVDQLRGQPGQRLEVAVRQEHPKRRETPARAHTFHTGDGLCRYLSALVDRHETVALTALFDAANGVGRIVLNEMSADGVEMLDLKTLVHPLMAPWAHMTRGKPMTLQSVRSIVLAERRQVVDPDVGSLLAMFGQVRVDRSTEVSIGHGPDTVNGVVVRTKIQGQEQSRLVPMPDNITVRAPLLVGDTSPVDVIYDLVLYEDGSTIVCDVASSDLQVKILERNQRMVERVADVVRDIPGCVVALGNVGHCPWDYVTSQ